MEWTEGPDFFTDSTLGLGSGVSLQYEKTFLAVGGENYLTGLYSEKIQEYQPDEHVFVTLNETMKNSREFFAGCIIPDDFISCQ
jgi:hypothetical protein